MLALTTAPLTVTDIVLIITTVTGAIVTVINAWASSRRGKVLVTKTDNAAHSARRAETQAVISAAALSSVVTERSDLQDEKLDKIQIATNGGVQALKDKVVVANERIDTLETLLKQALADLRVERAKP